MILFSKEEWRCFHAKASNVPSTAFPITKEEHILFVSQGENIKKGVYPFVVLEPKITTEQLQQRAKLTRDAAISAPIELGGAVYQIDGTALANIERTKRKAERDGKASTPWRLADNTWRETTIEELNQLIELADDRFEAVWSAFNSWDDGDKLEPFACK